VTTPFSFPPPPTDAQILVTQLPIRVGLVGTGFVAKLRGKTLLEDERSQLVAVAGHTPEKTQEFAQIHRTTAMNSWQELIAREDLDLVVICNINRDRGAIVRAALLAGCHVIVEYPLCLDPAEAEDLIALATARQRLLHVEHLELLGGVHQALKQSLSEVGEVAYARYSTLNPQRFVGRKWTYNRDLFGFPLTAALSRLHRLTDVLGTVATVSCQSRFWEVPTEPEYFRACLCSAQLRFTNGAIAEVIYGKGEIFFARERKFELHGSQGTLIFDGDQGQLVREDEITPLEVGTRRGLFAKDTQMVLDHLTQGTPLYVDPRASLYTLKVAEAARQAAETGTTIAVE
jgi:biliverdin reductase